MDYKIAESIYYYGAERIKNKHPKEYQIVLEYEKKRGNYNGNQITKAINISHQNTPKNQSLNQNDKIIHGKGTPVKTQQNIPKCPTCGSTNIKRITTLDRAISIGFLGLLSGDIGKNYECLNCKAKW